MVNIGLDGLNIKKVLINMDKDRLISVKMLVEATDINRHLDWIILTNYWLRMTKIEYVVV